MSLIRYLTKLSGFNPCAVFGHNVRPAISMSLLCKDEPILMWACAECDLVRFPESFPPYDPRFYGFINLEVTENLNKGTEADPELVAYHDQISLGPCSWEVRDFDIIKWALKNAYRRDGVGSCTNYARITASGLERKIEGKWVRADPYWRSKRW